MTSQEMGKNNITTVFLIGFPGPCTGRVLLFLLILIIYLTTIVGNLLVISLVSCSRNLHSPMYFFLTQLTASDIMTTSDIVPNMLCTIVTNGSSMSLPGCISQLSLLSCSECAECLILTVMSYDRYLAICRPLNYHSIMASTLCLKSATISWIISFLVGSSIAVNVSQLLFCRSNIIDHFFCDLDPVLELSCSDTFSVKMLSTSMAFPSLVITFIVIMISYGHIIHTVLKIQSISQREKAFSTCGSHLAVVSIFYGTLVTIYMTPSEGRSTTSRKVLSLVYCVVTPLLNPVIYCLRNKDIKTALRKILGG